jgi:hypothetical protein
MLLNIEIQGLKCTDGYIDLGDKVFCSCIILKLSDCLYSLDYNRLQLNNIASFESVNSDKCLVVISKHFQENP